MSIKRALAEQGIRDLEAVIAEENRKEKAKRYADAEERGRILFVAKGKAESELNTAQIVHDELVNGVTNKNYAIDAHHAKEPLAENFPSAEVVAKWRKTLDELTAQRNVLVQQARNADARLGRARMAFLEASGALDYQRQAITNLRNAGIQLAGSSISHVS